MDNITTVKGLGKNYPVFRLKAKNNYSVFLFTEPRVGISETTFCVFYNSANKYIYYG